MSSQDSSDAALKRPLSLGDSSQTDDVDSNRKRQKNHVPSPDKTVSDINLCVNCKKAFAEGDKSIECQLCNKWEH